MKDNTIWTIKELYQWACRNKVEDYTVFTSDEGCPCNIDIRDIDINKNDETVYL